MLHINLITGTFIIIACVIFHVAGLAYSILRLRALAKFEDRMPPRRRLMVVVVTAVLVVIALHTVEIWAWATVYFTLGEFSEFEAALYFSAVTATTLGYGDLTLSQQWRLLAPFEAMGGLILFGASTAYLLEVMRGLFAAFSSDEE